MSFWPKVRRRSRARKKRSSKANPDATREIDKYNFAHADSRVEFASDNGVHSIELVQFFSQSSRGWVHLPSEIASPLTNPPSPVSHDGEVGELKISNAHDTSHEFSPLGPAFPVLSTVECAASRGDGEEREAGSSSSAGNVVMGFDVKGGSRRGNNRLVISRNLKDEAWLQIRKMAAILFFKVLIFSRALEESTAFAFTVAVVVDIWNRGKGTFHRVCSALTTQLLTTLKPYLSLQQRKSATTRVLAAPKPVLQPSAPEQLSASNAMKVSPLAEGSVAQEIGSSSFVFPVFTRETVSTSPHFYVHQGEGDSSEIETLAESISSVPSPLVESNKLPSTKPCNRLKSKLFKSSPARKGENSSRSTDLEHSNNANSGSSSNSSPAHGTGSKKRASCNSKKPSRDGEEEWDGIEQPKSPLKAPKKMNRSHDLFFFRSPHNSRRKEAGAQKEIAAVPAVSSADVMNLSSSHELKFSLRSLGKRKVSRSQEFNASSPLPPVQDLTLPKSTVDRLESLSFAFKMERQAQLEERPSVPSSPRQSPNKRRSSLSKVMTMEPTYEKNSSRGFDSCSSSPRASSQGGFVKGGKSSKTASSCSTSVVSPTASAMLAPEELKPGLRRVRTAVPAGSEQHGPDARSAVSRIPPPPLQSTGELGRSRVLNRDILGSILLLAVLGFLMLGRIPAVFCLSCLCLTLSYIQRVVRKYFIPGDQEQLRRNPGTSRLQHEISSPVHWLNGNSSNHGSPSYEKSGLQSSEYRKRVLIEGLIDRGHRRGTS